MKNKASNKLFITFSLCALLVGLIAFKYLVIINKNANIAKSTISVTNGSTNSSCYRESEDPYITMVEPDCN